MATQSRIRRRSFLSGLSVVSGIGIAGCGGAGDGGDGSDGSDGGDGQGGQDGSDGGGSDGNLGERVPTLEVGMISGLPPEEAWVQGTGHIRDTLQDALGVTAEVAAKELGTLWEETYGESRTHSLHLDYTPGSPERLEPSQLLAPQVINLAGANGRGSINQYASCEYSTLVRDQQQAGSEAERLDLVHQALSVASQDIERINIVPLVRYGAIRTDQIQLDAGELGLRDYNLDLFIDAEGVGGNDQLIINGEQESLSTYHWPAVQDINVWAQLQHSPLVYFDKNLELSPCLATDWEVANGSQQFTFSIRENATFHDGAPILADDVKWTFEYIQDNLNLFPAATAVPYDSINVVDDHTVEFNMTEPYAPFIVGQASFWGVVHSELWIDEGAEDDPENFELDPIVGSGPFQVQTYRPGEVLISEPYDDHWLNPSLTLVQQHFQDSQAAFRAFQEGQLNVFSDCGASIAQQIDDQMGDDVARARSASQFTTWELQPEHSWGPTKFREFRHALSQALDREYLNEVLEYGNSEAHLYSCIMGETHPFYPDDHEGLFKHADSSSGSRERAREILAEEGWGWDSDGRLHYPPDADLTPLWPEGSTPMDHPDEFPCAEELEEEF